MAFSSLGFLLFFMVVWSIHWLLPRQGGRVEWLLLASLAFCALAHPVSLVLLLTVTAINHGLGLAVGSARQAAPRRARWLVAGALVVDLGCLGAFKYYDFFMQTGADLWGLLTGRAVSVSAAGLIVPLGISFYTFQLIGYVLDVYRGKCDAVRSPLRLCLFVAFFPRVLAGPILRADEFIPQLDSRATLDPSQLLRGLDLVCLGLFKKVLIADQLGSFVDRVFAAPDSFGSATLMLGVYAYAAQIYCDFSGYTDIARGCGRCLGYELPINFNWPYLSVNIIDFWRRWHITLSSWLRDYLYIPLGGSRQGAFRTYLNLMITMGLAGLWHGASWCFVVWGLLHGAALCATRFAHRIRRVEPTKPLFAGRAYRILATVFTFHLVCLGWVFFRAPSFSIAFKLIRGVLRVKMITAQDTVAIGMVVLGLVAVTLAGCLLLHLLGAWARHVHLENSFAWVAVRPVAYAVVTVGILLFAGRGAQQFIYALF